MPLLPILFVNALLHTYVGCRIALALPAGPWALLLVATLLASVLLMPLGLLARRIRRQPLSDRLAWAGLLAMGLFSSLFVLTLLRDALLVLAALGHWLGLSAAASPLLLMGTAVAVPLLGTLVTLLGFVNARRTAAVVNVDVPIIVGPT